MISRSERSKDWRIIKSHIQVNNRTLRKRWSYRLIVWRRRFVYRTFSVTVASLFLRVCRWTWLWMPHLRLLCKVHQPHEATHSAEGPHRAPDAAVVAGQGADWLAGGSAGRAPLTARVRNRRQFRSRYTFTSFSYFYLNLVMEYIAFDPSNCLILSVPFSNFTSTFGCSLSILFPNLNFTNPILIPSFSIGLIWIV